MSEVNNIPSAGASVPCAVAASTIGNRLGTVDGQMASSTASLTNAGLRTEAIPFTESSTSPSSLASKTAVEIVAHMAKVGRGSSLASRSDDSGSSSSEDCLEEVPQSSPVHAQVAPSATAHEANESPSSLPKHAPPSVQDQKRMSPRTTVAIGNASACIQGAPAQMLMSCQDRVKVGSVELANPAVYRREAGESGSQMPLFAFNGDEFYAIMKGATLKSTTGSPLLSSGTVVQVSGDIAARTLLCLCALIHLLTYVIAHCGRMVLQVKVASAAGMPVGYALAIVCAVSPSVKTAARKKARPGVLVIVPGEMNGECCAI